MQVRIGGVDDFDLVNGGSNNIAHTIFFAGCKRDCPGCHNKSLQSMTSGFLVDVSTIRNGIKENTVATAVVITGGEPLLQLNQTLEIAYTAKLTGKEVWLYTGKEFDDIPQEILEFVDVVKTGWYDETKRSDDYALASTNQKYHSKGADSLWKLK